MLQRVQGRAAVLHVLVSRLMATVELVVGVVIAADLRALRNARIKAPLVVGTADMKPTCAVDVCGGLNREFPLSVHDETVSFVVKDKVVARGRLR